MYKDVLSNNLHLIMRHDPLINEITGSIGLALDNLDKEIESLRDQLDIEKATWALKVYENELGIVTDIGKPLNERRSLIKSKFRGSGKIGAPQIKLVADSYTNGDVDVKLDRGIHIEFNSIYGIPSNIEDLKTVLREICPAHLNLSYTFKFVTYDDLRIKTHDQLADFTHDQIREGKVLA